MRTNDGVYELKSRAPKAWTFEDVSKEERLDDDSHEGCARNAHTIASKLVPPREYHPSSRVRWR